MKILIVEDDDTQASTLAEFLSTHQYLVDVAIDGKQALNYLEIFPYDLVILDLLLPKLDGISLCKRLRQKNNQIPILLLTVQNSLKTKVDGFSAGADDYLVKPFEKEELLARIKSLLRRGHIPIKPDLVWEKLCLNLNSSEVTYNGLKLNLTRTEYGFLEVFLRHPYQLFSPEQIIDHQFTSEHSYSIESVRSHIKGLRHKLQKAGVPTLIETVYGLGYRLRKDPSKPIETDNPSQTTQIEQTVALLKKSREKFKPSILEQIKLIEAMSKQLQQASPQHEYLLSQIQQETHQLIGLLGILGFTQGASYCSEIETILNGKNRINPAQSQAIRKLAVAIRHGLNESLSPKTPSLTQSKLTLESPNKQPQLLIVDSDTSWSERIKQEANHWGFEAIAVTTPTTARAQIQQHCPDIILIDFQIHPDHQDNINFLSELTQSAPSIPTLILTTQGSFSTRLEVSRLKPQAFLQKPMDPRQVMLEIYDVFQHYSNFQAQILIVDDHPPTLQLLKEMLTPYKLSVIPLEDSLQLWETLEKINPDLVILDLKMPHINGIDLCQVIRNDPRWHELPIIVLTEFNDIETVQHVLAAGADDIVGKAAASSELVARVMARLKRTPILQS